MPPYEDCVPRKILRSYAEGITSLDGADGCTECPPTRVGGVLYQWSSHNQSKRLRAKGHLAEAPSEEGAPPQAVREFPFQKKSNFTANGGSKPPPYVDGNGGCTECPLRVCAEAHQPSLPLRGRG